MAFTKVEKLAYRLIGINSNVIEIIQKHIQIIEKSIFKEATNVKTNDPAKLQKTVKSQINPNSSSYLRLLLIIKHLIPLQIFLKKFYDYSYLIFTTSTDGMLQLCTFQFKRNVPKSNTKFDSFKLNATDVSKNLSQIDRKSSPVYCGIPTKIFIAGADELKFLVNSLFNFCIETNRIPSDQKIAFVRPHNKGKDEKQDSENNRPISLHSPISEVFEFLIASRILLVRFTSIISKHL